VRTVSELLKLNAVVGNKLDNAAPDHEAMKFLLRARRAVRAELEARHVEAERVLEPYRFTGMTADGLACYDEV
jgi:hypothetical protein